MPHEREKNEHATVTLYCNNERVPVYNNEFEVILSRPETHIPMFTARLKAQLSSGETILKTLMFTSDHLPVDTIYRTKAKGVTNEGFLVKGKELRMNMLDQKMSTAICIPANALSQNTTISITALRDVDLPALNADMVNVTKASTGYRFLPHGSHFSISAKTSIPFDSSLIPEGYTAADIRTYYFDEMSRQWMALATDTILAKEGIISSATNHFTDLINGIIKVPVSPQTQGYTPTSIKDLKAADPASGIQLMEAPSANQMGTANMSFPIQVPAGRQGMTPILSATYNSGSGNSWMGLGWNVNLPSISIETRWGVPRYDANLESETYIMSGEQLAPLAHRGDFKPRSEEKRFYPRVEGSFIKIIRHGNSPKNYWWEVTTKTGTRYSYGGSAASNGVVPEAVLRDDAQNIAYWALVETRDLHQNFIHYKYTTVCNTGVLSSSKPGRDLYIDEIKYTGYGNTKGKYSILFTRQDSRPDIQISGRLGFKRVSAALLTKITVKVENETIRHYEFNYIQGPFLKTLLQNVKQFDAADAVVGNHEFAYFNDVEQNGQLVPFKSPQKFSLQKDDVHGNFISGSVTERDKASALGSTQGSDFGAGLYVGFGPWKLEQSTSQTAGFHYHYSNSETTGRVSIIDINGDGIPDKVFEKDGLWYRPRLKGPTLFGDKKKIEGRWQYFKGDK